MMPTARITRGGGLLLQGSIVVHKRHRQRSGGTGIRGVRAAKAKGKNILNAHDTYVTADVCRLAKTITPNCPSFYTSLLPELMQLCVSHSN